MITFTHVREALALQDVDGLWMQSHMAPGSRPMRLTEPPPGMPPARQAAVLILIYPEIGGGLHTILTRRTDHLNRHSGQISFPGGQCDPDDRSYEETALREACEELRICEEMRVLGRLTKVYIPPSNYDVYPVVATMRRKPQMAANPHEVAEVFTLPLVDLLSPHIRHSEERLFGDLRTLVPYYLVNGHKVWGATAAMLSELEHRLRRVLDMG